MDSIRRVAVLRRHISATLFSHSQSGHSGSSDSGTSNSYPSNNSACSYGSAQSTLAADFATDELTRIARQMVSDGYTQRMVQEFALQNQFFELHVAPPQPALLDGPDSVLESWFLELDVAWVLQIRQEHDLQWLLPLQDNSVSSLQDLVERWIRGLTVIVHSIVRLLCTGHKTTAVKGFGQASISKMLVFVDAVIPAFKPENLWAVLDMYICVCRAAENMMVPSSNFIDLETLMLFLPSISMLCNAIPSTMEKVRKLIEDDDSWAIEIPRGGGDVHRNTRLIADCIVSLGEPKLQVHLIVTLTNNSVSISNARGHTIHYLKHLLLRKSELCSDPSLRYLFLLNNSYFAQRMIEPCQTGHDWKLTPECEKYMYSYLDVSWGPVLSCIPKSHFSGPLHRWINTSSLDKFEAAFNKTYTAQKFWKVPDPQLRDELRRAIIERVVSSYRDYLKEHPELAEHVSRRNSTPEVMEEMLGQLFEG